MPGPAESSTPLKQYHLPAQGEVDVYTPRYCFEARIDFADVRSGLMETCTVSRSLEICPLDDDALWTEDMVMPLDAEALAAGPPPGSPVQPLPHSVTAEAVRKLETWVVLWLMRYYVRTLFRNWELEAYSRPHESLQDFQLRCEDLLSESCRHTLDEVREQFERKLDRVKETYFSDERCGDFDRERTKSKIASRIHNLSERMTGLFLEAAISADDPVPSSRPVEPGLPDYEHELRDLEAEACLAIARVLAVFREKARNTVEHVVHPSLRGVHVVRAGIVWMPRPGRGDGA